MALTFSNDENLQPTHPPTPQKEKTIEKIIPLTIKSSHKEGSFLGYASRYNVDLDGDQILPNAFTKTLENLKKSGKYLHILWQHQGENGPIGFCKNLYEDHKGLRIEGQLLLWKSQGKTVQKLIYGGLIKGLSVGFIPKKTRQDYSSNIRQILELDLKEISLVDKPANPLAYIEITKNLSHQKRLKGERKMGP